MNKLPPFDVSQHADVTMLALRKDRYMHDDILDLESRLRDFVLEEIPRNLLVDMRTVQLSTNALHKVLLDAKKTVEGNGGTFALCNLTSSVRDTLQVLHLVGHIFDVYDSATEAFEAFSSDE